MKRKVKFYWWSSTKEWIVTGKDITEIQKKCDDLCTKYHALHFEILAIPEHAIK